MTKTFYILCFCFISSWTFAQQEIFINIEIVNESLIQVFDQVERDHEISFSYNNELIKDIVVNGIFVKTPLKEFLTEILKFEKIKFEVVEEKYILISPDLNKKLATLAPPTISVCGIVKDELTLEAIYFANAYIKNTTIGTSCEVDGSFKLKGSFTEKDTLVISYVGYQTQEMLVKAFRNKPCRSITLILNDYQTPVVKVMGYIMDGVYLGNDANEVKIQPDNINQLPGQVEPDIMQSIQLLPGVISPDESASKIHIRGGTPDQNLVLWDNIPVYHTGHFFGSISAFNPYIVDEVNVWRGAFGVEYGGRVSGVVDIQSNNKIPEKINLGVGMNLTHGHAFAKIPIWKEKSAFILSYRRSFTDFWETPTFSKLKNKVFQGTKIEDGEADDNDLIELKNKFKFYDANAKWILKPTATDEIQVSFFTGKNSLEYSLEDIEDELDTSDELDLDNWGISANWEKKWNNKLSTKINSTYSDFIYNYQYINQQDSLTLPIEDINKSNSVIDYRIRLEGRYLLNDQHSLMGGYHFTSQEVGYNISEKLLFEENISEENNSSGKTQSLFLDYAFQNKKWLLNGGLRYNYFDLNAGHFFEPRFSIQWQPKLALKLKLNGGISHQFIGQLVDLELNSLGVNNEIWILSDEEKDSAIKGQQFALGFLYKKKGWQIDVEGYFKKLENITSLSTSFNTMVSDNFSTGTSNIIGVDILLKKRWKNYRTWISYTLAKADYTFEELSENSFPAFHDQRHTLSWMHMYKWKNLELSLGWNFHSGLPFTPLEDAELTQLEDEGEEYDVITPVLSTINSARLIPYHRLDFSATYSFPKSNTKRWEGKVGFSIQNMYNRYNVFSTSFSDNILDEDDPSEDDPLEIDKGLLEFTPNILLRFEWN